MKTNTISSTNDLVWAAFLTLALFAGTMLIPDMAMAAAGDAWIGENFCVLTDWATGATGKAIATLAIIVIGVGALMGKVSWGMAIIVALGIALVFGAATIIGDFEGGDGACGGAAAP